jgi:cytochrome c peroxidase
MWARWLGLSSTLIIVGLAAGCASTLETAFGPVSDNDFRAEARAPKAKIHLGRMLFFDKILSGNKNIACATCHHPTLGTGDGLALPIGEGGKGLGPNRRVVAKHPVTGRVPRNSPPLYFAGAKSVTAMFHDGRIAIDTQNKFKSGFISPAGKRLPKGLDSVLAVQAMFPVTSDREMAGQRGANRLATIAAQKRGNWQNRVWNLLARRLRAIPDYVVLFKQAYPEIEKKSDITYVHAANAIAAFEASAFRADQSPYDKFLRERDPTVLTSAARRGHELFYGKAGCAKCHSGPLQTDQKFHAIAMPQLGPGKGHGKDKTYRTKTGYKIYLEDEGRYAVTKDKADLFRFRTPSLRNVELTGPWGHAGAFDTLEAVIRHHADPVKSLADYPTDKALVPRLTAAVAGDRRRVRLTGKRLNNFNLRDTWVQNTPELRDRIAEANELRKTNLTAAEIRDLIAFMKALTDPRNRNQAHLVPAQVPSGLPVAD